MQDAESTSLIWWKVGQKVNEICCMLSDNMIPVVVIMVFLDAVRATAVPIALPVHFPLMVFVFIAGLTWRSLGADPQ